MTPGRASSRYSSKGIFANFQGEGQQEEIEEINYDIIHVNVEIFRCSNRVLLILSYVPGVILYYL